ncbi:pimeloyl-ACP methyl ester esterase BioH [Vibrio gallicus]|uniref:pimeloyl-ACP methyl ester esterase BioH n=1 Tax=Vibrio gallicus TaxID=190897 RepID=UPI0021C3788B|nr:pimeloyl-ACP methyl ester esterase BioH [Vibrio gallicus]
MTDASLSTTHLNWERYGQGPDLILLHGWGMNSGVWQHIIESLSQSFTLHLVDLPGYGLSHHQGCQSIEDICECVLRDAPQKAIWLGWSLGGLVATHIALNAPDRVHQLVTLASSPRFAAQGKEWRGIAPKVLSNFTVQLTEDFQGTIERFMALQALGSPSAKQDIKCLKEVVLSKPMPDPQALSLGLKLLAEIDYRAQLPQLEMPLIRLYGRLDGLVPVSIAHQLDEQLTEQSHIFQSSSHAPFISERAQFCELIRSRLSIECPAMEALDHQ